MENDYVREHETVDLRIVGTSPTLGQVRKPHVNVRVIDNEYE